MLGTLLFGAVGLLSGATVVARRPWTAVLSRRRYPADMQADPIFAETNRVITAGWTLYFAVAALACATGPGWLTALFAAGTGLCGAVSFPLANWYSRVRLGARPGGSLGALENRLPR